MRQCTVAIAGLPLGFGEAAICLALLLLHPVACSVLCTEYSPLLHVYVPMSLQNGVRQTWATCGNLCGIVQAGIKSRCAMLSSHIKVGLDPIRPHPHPHPQPPTRAIGKIQQPCPPPPWHCMFAPIQISRCSKHRAKKPAQESISTTTRPRPFPRPPRKHRNPPPAAPRSLPVRHGRAGNGLIFLQPPDSAPLFRVTLAQPTVHVSDGAAPSSPTRVSFSWRALPAGAIGLHSRVLFLYSGPSPCPAPGAQTTAVVV